jgi:hypothetical protein
MKWNLFLLDLFKVSLLFVLVSRQRQKKTTSAYSGLKREVEGRSSRARELHKSNHPLTPFRTQQLRTRLQSQHRMGRLHMRYVCILSFRQRAPTLTSNPLPISPPPSILTDFLFAPGSSQGRGPRCAVWFLEHVREIAGDNDMQVLVLEGGVKGWVQGGPRFTSLMDGFKPEHWEGLLATEEEKKGGEDGK